MNILFFRSLKFKISAFIILLLVISFFIFSAIFILSEKQNLRKDIVRNGEVFASFSAKTIYDNYVSYYTHNTKEDFENFKKNISDILSKNKDVVNIKLVGINGKILFNSDEFINGKYEGVDRIVEDINTLDLIRKNEMSNTSIEKGGKVFTETISPISYGTGHIFSVIYTISQDSLSERINEVYKQIFYVIVFVLVLVSFFTILFIKRLIKPIDVLINATKRIISGDLDFKTKVNTKDEIGQLSIAFDEMTERLKTFYSVLETKIKERTVELEKERQSLKNRVKERTKELEGLKNDLEIIVDERTKKLNDKLDELQRINKLMIDRELKMIELKKEIDILKNNKIIN